MRPTVVLLTSIALIAPAREAAAQRQATSAPSRVYTTIGLSKGAGALTCSVLHR